MKPSIASQRVSVARQNAASYFVDRHAQEGDAHRAAILHDLGQITYGELARSVSQVGNRLLEIGVLPEQRVLLHLHDGPEWVYFFMGAIKAGAVAVPVNSYCTTEQLAFYLNDSRARIVVTHRRYADKISAIKTAPLLEQVLYVEDMAWKVYPTKLAPFPAAPDDSAFWLYTSGSTGVPKAVIHRHAGMIACAEGFARDVLDIKSRDRCYSASKSFFAYGLGNSIIFPFSVGATSVLSSQRSDIGTVIGRLRDFKPTLFFAVPALYSQLLASPLVNRELFSSVRMCVSAGEYLPETLFESWRSRTGQMLYDGIGSTEAMHIFCSNRPRALKAGTSGVPVSGYELKIVDVQGVELGVNEVGRLLVRGKTTAKGYWNRHEANQRSFLGEWLATGDIYQRTEDGYYRYLGREDDVFKSSGMWVSPGEVEQVLLTCPHVREAAVVGVRNAAGTSSPKAFVVLEEPAQGLDAEEMRHEILRHLRTRLSRYKIPEHIEFVPELPKTATGKVSRAELRRSQGESYLPSAASAN